MTDVKKTKSNRVHCTELTATESEFYDKLERAIRIWQRMGDLVNLKQKSPSLYEKQKININLNFHLKRIFSLF